MTVYYVSINGNDNNNGLSRSTAWRGIQKAFNSLSAGDTLYIMEGEYDPGDEDRDYWELVKKRGREDNPIVIESYGNEKVILTGRASGESSGFPQTGLQSKDNVDGYLWTHRPLVRFLSCTHVTLRGIEIRESLGMGLDILGDDGVNYDDGIESATSHHILVENCRVHNTRHRNMRVKNSWGVAIRNCDLSFGSWALRGGTGGLDVENGYFIHFDRNVVHEQAGESFIADANNFYSRNIYMTNNVVFDCEGPIILHALTHAICVGNFVYITPQEANAPKGFTHYDGNAITVKSSECNKPVQKSVEFALVAHNIVVDCQNGIQVINDDADYKDDCIPNFVPMPIRSAYVVNNTVVESTRTNFAMVNKTAESCVLKGNLSVHSDPTRHIRTFYYGNINGWEADYNLYNTTPDIVPNLVGEHDLNGVNPKLVNPKAPNKGQVTLQEAGYYASFDLADGYDDASGFKIKSDSPCIDAFPGIVEASGWSEIDDYLNWSFNFEGTNSEPTRSGSREIGAHELIPENVINADFSASPLAGIAPLTVSFKDQSTASRPITSWFWDFGDGSISTQANPSHTYNQGTFTVSLRVASGELSDILTKQNLITITPPNIESAPRVTDGLSVMYRFDEGSGTVVYDVSGIGAPLDLNIADPTKVAWLNPGLQIVSPTAIASIGPAEKINNACRETNGITLELWLKPANTSQSGPARIASLSRNAYSRNVTIGQGLWGSQPTDLYDVRLRTTESSANGMPSLSSPEGSLESKIRHVVFTRAPNGVARIYINGTIVAEESMPGDFSTWNPRYPLVLGNETGGDYPWLGELYLLAVYDRALSTAEVRLNRDAGRPIKQEISYPGAVSLAMFRRFVIVSNDPTVVTAEPEAFGVQYPDQRCVICTSNGSTTMTIYDDVNKAVGDLHGPNVEIRWLD